MLKEDLQTKSAILGEVTYDCHATKLGALKALLDGDDSCPACTHGCISSLWTLRYRNSSDKGASCADHPCLDLEQMRLLEALVAMAAEDM